MENVLKIILLVVSLLLIAVVLLQSGKAEQLSSTIMGGSDLYATRKERGGELFMTRLTMGLGIIFFVLSFIIGF